MTETSSEGNSRARWVSGSGETQFSHRRKIIKVFKDLWTLPSGRMGTEKRHRSFGLPLMRSLELRDGVKTARPTRQSSERLSRSNR